FIGKVFVNIRGCVKRRGIAVPSLNGAAHMIANLTHCDASLVNKIKKSREGLFCVFFEQVH
ncbi:hypothetical protein, partial [Lonsdalea populi]|uniref:hypothetical protein n=1 Tax=Lonsdalea populi TaxID=1172565 RepID=UPI001C654FC0